MSETGTEYTSKSPAESLVDEILNEAKKRRLQAETKEMVAEVIKKGETIAEANKQAEELAKARNQAENLAKLIAEKNGLNINNLQDKGEIIRLMNEIRGDDEDLSIELVKLKRFLSKQ